MFRYALRIATDLGLPEDRSLLRADLEQLRRALERDGGALPGAIR